jgi:hypothetical protein
MKAWLIGIKSVHKSGKQEYILTKPPKSGNIRMFQANRLIAQIYVQT